MKRLYIIRHAKSSWQFEDLPDFDRPLNERGKRDAPRMGKRLKEMGVVPDSMITSNAKRALSTCKRIAEALDFPKKNIKELKSLYHADEEKILKVINEISDKHDVVLLFGHNPGLTDFVNALSNDHRKLIDNVPTCGVVCFELNVDEWKDLKFGEGELVYFDYPKNKPD